MTAGRFERLLKWYPSRWRARYGEELVALMEDTYGEGSLPLSSQLSIMRTGATEHLREMGLGGGEDTPGERVRSGSQLVLCGWPARFASVDPTEGCSTVWSTMCRSTT